MAAGAIGLLAVCTAPTARADDPLGILPGGPKPSQEPQSSPAKPPPGGILLEGEALAPGTPRNELGTSQGAYLRTPSAAGATTLPAGTYKLTARVRGPQLSRTDLTFDGAMVGSFTTAGAWRRVSAVGWLVSDGRVGITSSPLPGLTSAEAVDVDWIHVEAAAPTYTTKGSDILDLSGTPFRPRGVDRQGYHAPGSWRDRLILPPSEADHVHMWGATAVRVPLNQEHWLADCPATIGGVSRTYRDAVASEIAEYTAHGILVLLTLEITERGRATGCEVASKPFLKEMADYRSRFLWASVAGTFKHDPLVAFDLFNEPHDISDQVWLHGGTVAYEGPAPLRQRRTYEAAGMQSLYDTVRATGAHNLVFVSGTAWASDPRAALRRPLDGYGLVVASHAYCFAPECEEDDPHLSRYLEELNTAEVRARHPLVVTETGWPNPADGRYNRMIIDWAEQRKVGWIVFAWAAPTADAPSEFGILRSWDASWAVAPGVGTHPPAPSGVPVWNSLAPFRTARGFTASPVAEP